MQLKEAENTKPKSSSENDTNDDEDDEQAWGRKNNISLLDQHTELKKLAEGKQSFVITNCVSCIIYCSKENQCSGKTAQKRRGNFRKCGGKESVDGRLRTCKRYTVQ